MGYEVDPKAAKLLQCENQLLHAAGEPVKAENYNHIESAAAGVGHECFQSWPGFLGAAGPVGIDAVQGPPALCNQISQRLFLYSRILVERGGTAPFRHTGRAHAQVRGRADGVHLGGLSPSGTYKTYKTGF